jgi:hypothetical protein
VEKSPYLKGNVFSVGVASMSVHYPFGFLLRIRIPFQASALTVNRNSRYMSAEFATVGKLEAARIYFGISIVFS